MGQFGNRMGKLRVKQIEKLTDPGMYNDGDGLYLRLGPTGAKSWILRTRINGKKNPVDLGLGSLSLVELSEAREEARALRKVARSGGDPRVGRRQKEVTFEEAARKKHAELLPTWRNPGHGKRWMSSLEMYAFPHFGSRIVGSIDTGDVLTALSPIWASKHDTARRVKQRISTVFDWAKGHGHYVGENPVAGVESALPTVRVRQEHMPSMPWRELPNFMSRLAQREGVSARALEFLILTCCRSGEVRGAKWSEIQNDVWEIPGDRMKTGLPHRVPITGPARAVLDAVAGVDPEYVFPSLQPASQGRSRPMSDTVFRALTDRMGQTGFTTHGFRSTFRDWCSESARADREVAEAALAHSIGNKVEKAYARSDLFDRRRELMDAWARYAVGFAGDVIELARA